MSNQFQKLESREVIVTLGVGGGARRPCSMPLGPFLFTFYKCLKETNLITSLKFALGKKENVARCSFHLEVTFTFA